MVRAVCLGILLLLLLQQFLGLFLFAISRKFFGFFDSSRNIGHTWINTWGTGATAIASVMLAISFLLLLSINVLQWWSTRRQTA